MINVLPHAPGILNRLVSDEVLDNTDLIMSD